MEQPKLHFYDMGREVVAFSSTRLGGYSIGNYAAFNINRYCDDTEESILKNREALCSLLGISDDRLIMPHQVHLTKTVQIDSSFLALTEDKRREALEGVDALMTNLPEVCIGVSTADCIPVLIYDKEHHAACAIHAGWRGTVARIVEKAVAAMTEAYGSRPAQLSAQIGPGISIDSFEVGNEVYEAFVSAGFDMTPISDHKGKWHINLPECNRLQLISMGVPTEAVSVLPVCTFQNPDQYFSARRLGINSGRIFTGIIIKNK